jgi:dTDP-4-amino-4,6-dideoxygalactose transaminase
MMTSVPQSAHQGDARVTKIHVTKTYLPDVELYTALIQHIWRSGQITNGGTLCRDLQQQLIKYLEVPHLELLSNGTLALQLAIKALNLRGEIITTPYSYVATTNAILWEGCDPVFVDICPKTFCIDPEKIEKSITARTSAILATHVYGYPCEVDRIQEIAEKYRLRVIYDAAHAFGVRYKERSLLACGDCSTLSFHATKLFHTGEGGAVVSADAKTSERIALMSKFGHLGEDNYLDIGINAKMSELHAAMGLCVLPTVRKLIEDRRGSSSYYDECLHGTSLTRPTQVRNLEYNYAYYPVVFSDHQAMMEARKALLGHSIVPRRYFHPSLNTLAFLPPHLRVSCPVSESIASRVLCLPLYAGIERVDIKRICKIITG